MTRQPDWKLVANLGDVDIVGEGGFLIFEDATGVYYPEAEVYVPEERRVYRFSLEPPRFKTRTEKGKGLPFPRELPPSERGDTWHWYKEWWVDKLPSVASSVGMSTFQLLRLGFSKDPVKQGILYEALVGYFGAFEFDDGPLTLCPAEAEARYAKYGRTHVAERVG